MGSWRGRKLEGKVAGIEVSWREGVKGTAGEEDEGSWKGVELEGRGAGREDKWREMRESWRGAVGDG